MTDADKRIHDAHERWWAGGEFLVKAYALVHAADDLFAAWKERDRLAKKVVELEAREAEVKELKNLAEDNAKLKKALTSTTEQEVAYFGKWIKAVEYQQELSDRIQNAKDVLEGKLTVVRIGEEDESWLTPDE